MIQRNFSFDSVLSIDSFFQLFYHTKLGFNLRVQSHTSILFIFTRYDFEIFFTAEFKQCTFQSGWNLYNVNGVHAMPNYLLFLFVLCYLQIYPSVPISTINRPASTDSEFALESSFTSTYDELFTDMMLHYNTIDTGAQHELNYVAK